MIKIEHVEVLGWDHAIRGMRNPMNSWDRSDSCIQKCGDEIIGNIGVNDLKLMKQLIKFNCQNMLLRTYSGIVLQLIWLKTVLTWELYKNFWDMPVYQIHKSTHMYQQNTCKTYLNTPTQEPSLLSFRCFIVCKIRHKNNFTKLLNL